MKYFIFLSIVFIMAACGPATAPANEAPDTATAVPPQAISLVREMVNEQPVATFQKKIPHSLNDWYFKVAVFETRDRFSFLVKMQYEAIAATDTIRIPNLQKEPKVSLQPGKGAFSCIIGFHDKEGVFKPYKEVTATGGRLSIATIRHYAVAPVRK